MATAAKSELRSRIREKLSALDVENVAAQSAEAQRTIITLPQFQQADRIGIYLSMPTGEAQTDTLVKASLLSGKSVFVPYIYSIGAEKPKRKVMDMLRLESMDEYYGLKRDSWGIPSLSREGREGRENAMGGRGLSFTAEGSEHKAGEDQGGLDMIVVPAVAFDRSMNRMGHGAGFYDRFLTRFCDGDLRSKPFLGQSTPNCVKQLPLMCLQLVYAWQNRFCRRARNLSWRSGTGKWT
jgi:5-formyltetrahydrofolate cyclo-ligase